MKRNFVVLTILDGFGLSTSKEGNAILNADIPNLKRFFQEYPFTTLKCSGLDVGLPEGQMGNSEVGHLNIGAGRIVYQEFTRISQDIKNGDFFKKEELLEAIENTKKHNSRLHLMGLVSDGGVHSHNTHLYALLTLAKRSGLSEVYIHAFLDGRDVPPDSARSYIAELEEKIREIGVGKIATISGRYYAMDRDKRWERIKLAYDAIVLGKGETGDSALEIIERSYEKGIYDEFVLPTVVTENGRPIATIKPYDSVIYFNFRPDRARELTYALIKEDFSGFERPLGYFPLFFVTMTQYDEELNNVRVVYKPQVLKNNLGEYLSSLGLKQLRIAETEKYAHVTYFFNGGIEEPNENEERILIPSPKVLTYDLKPEMSAYEVTDTVIEKIENGDYHFIVINYANCDMVGHTGNYEATVKAVEAVDRCVGMVVDAVLKKNGVIIITGDHGNAEQMVDPETGGAHTAHTSNEVPFVLIGMGNVSLRNGRLSDIAPTILDIMRISKPAEMSGESLIIK